MKCMYLWNAPYDNSIHHWYLQILNNRYCLHCNHSLSKQINKYKHIVIPICPANTQCNNHIIITSKHCFNIIIRYLVRCVFAGCWLTSYSSIWVVTNIKALINGVYKVDPYDEHFRTRSMPWMTWLRTSPGHQHQCHWQRRTKRSSSSMKNNFYLVSS